MIFCTIVADVVEVQRENTSRVEFLSAIAPPLLKNLQIAEGSNQVLKELQISMAPAQRSKQLAPIWCCLAQEKGCSASQLQRGL